MISVVCTTVSCQIHSESWVSADLPSLLDAEIAENELGRLERVVSVVVRDVDPRAAESDDVSSLFSLQRFQELVNKGGAGVVRICCVGCLAHLAVLCEAPGQPGTLWDSTLERLGEVVGDMPMEEFTRLDLLLGVCAYL